MNLSGCAAHEARALPDPALSLNCRLYCCTAGPQALAELVGFEIKRDEVTSLRRLLDHDIAVHLAKITELSDTASR